MQYNPRRYAGHSSAWTEYYRNGQVRKLELSNAPDAGIQYYKETIFFDQNVKKCVDSSKVMKTESLLRLCFENNA